MSRHHLPSKQPGLSVACGWDNGMATYFATVTIDQADDDHRDLQPVLDIGNKQYECLDPKKLAEHLAPYADLDQAMLGQLADDRASAPPRTALQRWGANLGKGRER